jgi:hypothetical protein
MREGGCRPILPRLKTAAPSWGALAGITLLLAASVPAHAQQSPIPVRLKLGVLNVQDRGTRRHVGSTLFGGEAEVTLPSMAAGQTSIGIGYYERRDNGNSFRVIPITVTRLFSPPNPASSLTGNLYFGAGAGVYYLRKGGTDADDETTLGGFGVVGYQFPKPILFFDSVEAKYHATLGSANGVRPNGISIMLGRRL